MVTEETWQSVTAGRKLDSLGSGFAAQVHQLLVPQMRSLLEYALTQADAALSDAVSQSSDPNDKVVLLSASATNFPWGGRRDKSDSRRSGKQVSCFAEGCF